ncbi:TRAP transporter small permease subunit [candidate division KSB1 bacterium]|nr:TRAP transporter small permease subunit [candidate division KSB1 bacterium]
MGKSNSIVELILKWILTILMSALVIDVIWQVFSRFILNNPSSYTEELATFLLIWVALLGSAYALKKKAHLGIDLMTNYLKTKNRAVFEIIISFLVITIVTAVFIIGGIRLVYITLKLNQTSPALQIKMGYIYLAMPLAGFLMMYYMIAEFFAAIKNMRGFGND